MLKSLQQCWAPDPGGSTHLTGRQTLEDHSGGSVEDDVSAIVEVMQVVPTVETSVAKDVIQQQLLKSHQNSESMGKKSIMAGL